MINLRVVKLKKIAQTFFMVLAFVFLLSSVNSAYADYDSAEERLTRAEMENAIEIANVNSRPVVLELGESVVYKLAREDIYLKVFADSSADIAGPDAPVTLTQTCGINVFVLGQKVAQLRNRANITYFNGVPNAPAKFNWVDMQGTQTVALGYTWLGLSQSTSPALGQYFSSSGYSQASGTLQRCVLGWCKSDYFVSRLNVTTTNTNCQ